MFHWITISLAIALTLTACGDYQDTASKIKIRGDGDERNKISSKLGLKNVSNLATCTLGEIANNNNNNGNNNRTSLTKTNSRKVFNVGSFFADFIKTEKFLKYGITASTFNISYAKDSQKTEGQAAFRLSF